jgi:2-polyprenyl-3-methyl-5-hydroxy-6-metoxy-1,4-benzoquinol methylase/uncharacterized protein YbaR (Trm112 family)
MRTPLYRLLVCPDCQESLALAEGTWENDIVREGKLLCQRCQTIYPIRNGIPRFIPDAGYAKNFGFEWTVHRTTQLDTGRSHDSENAMRAKTGLTPGDLRGRLVLDVGCGSGRFSEVATRWGSTVVGIDLSEAVDACQQNLGDRPNMHIVQANIFHLPFRPETFDVVFSIGVLHHTPDCRKAFETAASFVKPGGEIAIWLYSTHPRTLMSDPLRRVTTRLPKRLLYALAHVAVPLYYVYRIPLLGKLFFILMPISLDRRPRWRILDTYDWYSPIYQSKHTYPEVYRWFTEAGLVDVQMHDIPVSVRGRRPPAVLAEQREEGYSSASA